MRPGAGERVAGSERIVIAGASGFMGTRLRARFEAEGARVATVGRPGRDADAEWGDTAGIAHLVDGADLLLNLAGRSVNCRYTDRNRAEIFRSRLATTTELGRATAMADTPPRVWINSSTATIYRHADDRPQTDEDGDLGSGFSVDVARAWERAFFEHPRDGMRQVALRTSIVLGDGSALTPILGLARAGLGGPQIGGRTPGGRQMFSWVHIDDVGGAIRFLLDADDLDGPVNLASPNPVTNRELMRTVRRAVGAPVGLPAYGPMLEVGAWALRTETELIVKSRWVLPTRLLARGFAFRHPRLDGALEDILGGRSN